jgi:cytochrome o ubiquinol oxidase subunit 3
MTGGILDKLPVPDLEARANLTTYRYPGLNLGAEHVDADTRAESLLFGFWVFLMSDAILFGMAFATYVTMVPAGIAGGPGPNDLFHLGPVLIETMVLLASSFTFGLASIALKYKHATGQLVGWLVLTLLLGVLFLGFELNDFRTMFAAGGVPTRSGFLSAFFGLVPLHGLHVTAGCIWIGCLLAQITRHGVDTDTKLGLLRLALFWHFLDIVWVFIFSVVYLGGLA